jgi:hypothetical protein
VVKDLLGRAAVIAEEAHQGQLDRAGAPYILHPLHLAAQASTVDERIVALLHDVVEDTAWDLPALAREGFSETVLRAIDALTRRPDETYDDFVERVARDRLATRVKILDLSHNSDLSRLPSATEEDRARVRKYERARKRLEDELDRRNLYLLLDAESRSRALESARLSVPKAEHVTLARRVYPKETGPIFGEHAAGDKVAFHAVASCADERVQVWVVRIDGSTVRPFDGGTLHLTVSRSLEARSKDANDVLRTAPHEAIDVELRGTLAWIDE